jgi:hypothetical protein
LKQVASRVIVFSESSDYVRNRREMDDSNTVSFGSPVGESEPLAPIGSQLQPNEPVGDKDGITRMALKMAGCSGLGKYREVVRV